MTSLSATRISMVALALIAFVGCGTGAPATRAPGTTAAPPTSAGSTPVQPGSGEGLCNALTDVLAVEALGGPVDEPSGGDVVPRGNGVYCRYSLTGDANTNVEAQLKDMPREEFEALAATLGATAPLPAVGEVAFSRDSSIMGISGAAVVAWSDGQGVTVNINREGGDQTQMLAAAAAIAAAVLLASP